MNFETTKQFDKMVFKIKDKSVKVRLGEAAARILKFDPAIPITNARKIVDLRNWVIHGYDKIDDVIIWGIISRQLPDLKNEVEDLLKAD